jgi:transcriptional regulator with XRE-family HTH domain
MPGKERLAHIGNRRGERLVREYADAIRDARQAASLSQRSVAAAAGMSKATVSRMERGVRPLPDLILAARVARVVGLDLTVKCFPSAGPLRDAAHVKLLGKLIERLHGDVRRDAERPVRAMDQRAWDLLLTVGDQRIGVAAETRLRDLQALLRREFRKLEDGSVDRLLVVVAGTHANRAALADGSVIISEALPTGTRQVMRALARAEPLAAHGLALI